MSWDKKTARYISPATATAVLFGAVVGGVAAAAANARKVKNGEMSGKQATLCALREAGTTGVASGAGVAAMAALRVGGVVGLVGIAAVATGAKYLMDSVLDEVLVKGGRKALAAACCAGAEADRDEAVSAPAAAAAKAAPKASAKVVKAAKAAKASKPRAPRKAAAKAEPETFITE